MIPVIRPGDGKLHILLQNRGLSLEKVEKTVKNILEAVKQGGDRQLCRITLELDGVDMEPARLPVTKKEIENAYRQVDNDFLTAIRRAAENIFSFHRRQLKNSWLDPQPNGTVLGQLLSPLHRVGIYVPGGKASYPSSVLMNAIPASVAGVPEIVMVTPPGRNGDINPHTLVAASEAGITEIYRVGGAQAVAALAYGTETIKKVEKITGPGNIYVTAAKRLVFGTVDIDMLAGPSEVLIVADGTARPDFIAADMLAQAEHDEMASAILVTSDTGLAEAVKEQLSAQLKLLSRRHIAEKSLTGNGVIVLTSTIEEAVEVANSFAPEHLELMVAEPYRWLGRLTAAGAVFIGNYSPEAIGDYIAGPNHVLPTSGTAKFFSPLNVDTFMKKTSFISYSPEALRDDGIHAIVLAKTEGLDAHAASVAIRLNEKTNNSHTECQKHGSHDNGPDSDKMPELNHTLNNTEYNDNWKMRDLPGMKSLRPRFGELHEQSMPPGNVRKRIE